MEEHGAPVGEEEGLLCHDEPLVPPQLPVGAVAAPGHEREGRRVLAPGPRWAREVLGEAPLGPLEGDNDPRHPVRVAALPALLPGKLEDLEAVLRYRNPHALEEFVVEIGDVVVLELVLSEG